MSLNRPDIYQLLDTFTLEQKKSLLEYLQAEIAAEKAAPPMSYLQEQWKEIERLLSVLEYEPYLDDQWEISEIWEMCEEIIQSGRLKEESWEARRQILEKIIQNDYYEQLSVYDPMRDLFNALCFSKEEKLECAEMISKEGYGFIKKDGAVLYRECGKPEKYYDYVEEHLSDTQEPYLELIDYYRDRNPDKAATIAELGLKKCRNEQTELLIFLLQRAIAYNDQGQVTRLIKSAKLRRSVNYEKVMSAVGVQ